MQWLAVLFLALISESVSAQALIASRHIPARVIITAEDIDSNDTQIAVDSYDMSEIIGKEARVSIYKGRVITTNDVVAPAVIERNQPIEIVFTHHQLSIQVSGRALQRGALGESIRVMNSASKKTVQGVIRADGRVTVEGRP